MIPWGEADIARDARPGNLSSPNPTADLAGVDERTFCTYEWTASQAHYIGSKRRQDRLHRRGASVAAASPSPARPAPPPTANGTRSPAANPAATGPSTPATATRAACSSPRAPGPATVAASTPRPPTWPPRTSRSPSPSACWPPRAAAHGPCADAASPARRRATSSPTRRSRSTTPRSTASCRRRLDAPPPRRSGSRPPPPAGCCRRRRPEALPPALDAPLPAASASAACTRSARRCPPDVAPPSTPRSRRHPAAAPVDALPLDAPLRRRRPSTLPSHRHPGSRRRRSTPVDAASPSTPAPSTPMPPSPAPPVIEAANWDVAPDARPAPTSRRSGRCTPAPSRSTRAPGPRPRPDAPAPAPIRWHRSTRQRPGSGRCANQATAGDPPSAERHPAPGQPGRTCRPDRRWIRPRPATTAPTSATSRICGRPSRTRTSAARKPCCMGLTQRGMNTPYPEQAPGPNVPLRPDRSRLPVLPPAPERRCRHPRRCRRRTAAAHRLSRPSGRVHPLVGSVGEELVLPHR